MQQVTVLPIIWILEKHRPGAEIISDTYSCLSERGQTMNESEKIRVDMSGTCGRGQLHALKTLSDEEYDKWYAEHCDKCIHEHVVCMYGED